MPFPYQASATPVRTRKPLREREKDKDKDRERDKDTRSITSGSSRRHRETSRSSNRSPLPSASRPSSLYNQTNVTVEQLPSLPRSETASPSSLKSPTVREGAGQSSTAVPLTSSIQPYTPAALQPYLETDDDEDFDNAKTPQASAIVRTQPYFEPDVTKTPQASSIVRTQPYFEPEVTKTPLQQDPTKTSLTISPTTLEAKLTRTPSPQQDLASPLTLSRVNTRRSDPTPTLQHPRPFHFSAGSPPFTQALPFFGGPPSDPYLPHLPPAPQYFPMGPASTHPLDLQPLPPQSYYQPYGSPPQMPSSFNPMRSPPAREYSSTSSRLSFSSDPTTGMGPTQTVPVDAPSRLLEGAGQGASKGEEDAVLQRIQSAIPDLHLLLNRYRETSGQLGERELTLRHTEAEKMKVLGQKDSYIDRLTKERDEALHRHSEENNKNAEEKSKMRLEIGNMSEQHNELQEKLLAEKKASDNLKNLLHESQAQYALLMAQTSSEKAAMIREHENATSRMGKDLAAMEKDLRVKETDFANRLQRQVHESETLLQAQIAELEQKHGQSREALESSWSKQKSTLEDTHTKLRRELDDVKSAHQKTVDEHQRNQLLKEDTWLRERQLLMKDWESERAKWGQGSVELLSRHQKEKDDIQKEWISSRTRLEKEHSDSTAKMQTEIDRLKAAWDADKSHFNKVKAELKATAAKLDTENTKLQKLADAFEQVTDLKGRGDAYYVEAFDLLWQQISTLAEDFCSKPPSHLSLEVARTIPSNIPPFLTDTPASTRLRIPYVQSLVSDVITSRIFQPFLFTHENFDDTFNEWAEYLRHKSTKREAVWRQRTLHAAFSCRSSKSKINMFAQEVIEEISSAIRPFADSNKKQQLMDAVKQVVKMAAETWRFARIEMSRITALPAIDPVTGHDGELLLSVFPRIEREPSPKGFRADSGEDTGCVYSTGQTLTRTSSAVFARRVELGEISPPPAAADQQQQESDGRPEWKRPRKMSSEIANRARKFEPRSISPLIPREGSPSNSKGKAATVSDDVSSQHGGEQQEPGGGWDAIARHRNSNTPPGGKEHEEYTQPKKSEWSTAAHAAGTSPPQSPARSRTQSPQLSRRSTDNTGSVSGGDEASETKEKPGTAPDWGGAGQSIPGGW